MVIVTETESANLIYVKRLRFQMIGPPRSLTWLAGLDEQLVEARNSRSGIKRKGITNVAQIALNLNENIQYRNVNSFSHWLPFAICCFLSRTSFARILPRTLADIDGGSIKASSKDHNRVSCLLKWFLRGTHQSVFCRKTHSS